MKKLINIAVTLCLLIASPLYAAEVADVKIAETVKLAGSDTELVLNGAGVRWKFIFKIYIGALYLTGKTDSPEQAIDGPGEKRMLMHFLYDEVSKKKLTDAWWEGFKDNHTTEALARLNDRIGVFSDLFTDAHKGDEIWLDNLPGKGTQVTINGKIAGTVPGDDFYPSLLRVWLGESPVTSDLKKAMLGIE